MDWVELLLKWARPNQALLWWLFAGSVAVFLLTPIAVAWAVIRLPKDYFTEERRHPLGSWDKYPLLRVALLVVKNYLGIVLLVAGVLMLLMPGQGLLTIAGGLILIDFPGKLRFERWIATRRSVWRSINWLRKRAGRDALAKPQARGGA